MQDYLVTKKHLAFGALSILGFLTVIISAFPGYTNFDEMYMLNEGLNHHISDIHPPMQMLIWLSLIKLAKLFGGNELLQISSTLLIQNIVFWLSAYHIAKWFNSFKLGLLFLAAILAAPVGLVYLGHIGKDSEMAIAFFSALALIGQSIRTKNRKLLLVSIIPIFFGLSIRSNGIIAAVPLVIIMSDQIINNFSKVKLNKYILAIAILISLVSCNLLIKEVVIKEKCCDAAQALMTPVYDLMSISTKVNQNLVPKSLYLNDKYNLETIKNNFNETYINWDGLIIPSHKNFKEVIQAWLNGIYEHPNIFIIHRVRTLQLFLGLHQGGAPFPFMYGFYCDPNTISGFNQEIAKYCQAISKIDTNYTTNLNNILKNYILNSNNSFMYKIWPYILASLLIIMLHSVFLKKHNAKKTSKENLKKYFWIWQSAIINILPFLLLANSAQFRYLIWSALSLFVFTMLSVDEIFMYKPRDSDNSLC